MADFLLTSWLIVKALLVIAAWAAILGLPGLMLYVFVTEYQDSRMFGDTRLGAMHQACVTMITVPCVMGWMLLSLCIPYRWRP